MLTCSSWDNLWNGFNVIVRDVCELLIMVYTWRRQTKDIGLELILADDLNKLWTAIRAIGMDFGLVIG